MVGDLLTKLSHAHTATVQVVIVHPCHLCLAVTPIPLNNWFFLFSSEVDVVVQGMELHTDINSIHNCAEALPGIACKVGNNLVDEGGSGTLHLLCGPLLATQGRMSFNNQTHVLFDVINYRDQCTMEGPVRGSVVVEPP